MGSLHKSLNKLCEIQTRVADPIAADRGPFGKSSRGRAARSGEVSQRTGAADVTRQSPLGARRRMLRVANAKNEIFLLSQSAVVASCKGTI
jgi:hypothetical protein